MERPRGLASLLYAMLVLRWRGGNAWGLEAAPVIAGEPAPPHTVATGVSPALDQICTAALTERGAASDHRITTASQLAAALASVLGTADASADLEARVRQPQNPIPGNLRPATLEPMPAPDAAATQIQPAVSQQPRQKVVETRAVEDVMSAKITYEGRPLLWMALLAAIATLVSSLIVVAINSLGPRPSTGDSAAPSPAASESQGTSEAGTVVPVASANDFDPRADNGNGEEHADQAKNAIDGDAGTGWSTVKYWTSAMGGEKPGVGLVRDLGQPVQIGEVEVNFAAAGENVELRVPAKEATDKAPMDRQAQWKAVANAEGAAEKTVLKPSEPVTSRYLLVYLTKLPEVSKDRYSATINEIVVKHG